MRHGTDTFTTSDGLTLWRQWWLPDGDPRAAVMLLHGLGEHSGRYEHVAAALAHAGYAVHAVDHRGHGRSEGPRAFVRNYDEFMVDVATFRRLVEAQHPSAPLVVLGHSMGANLAVGHVLDHQDGLAGLALSGAALAPGASLKPATIKAAKLLGRFLPKLRPDKLDAEAISRDAAVVARYRNDRLVYTGRLSAGIAGALLAAMERFPARYAELRLPILILHGTADALADVTGSRRLEAGAVNATVTSHYYDGLYHEVFNEPEQDRVIADLLTWLGSLGPASDRAVASPA
jgi:acylglycerol lipase